MQFRAIRDFRQINPFLNILFLLIVGNLLIFKDFIFGEKCLMYDDIGADSVVQILPFTYFFTNIFQFDHLWIHGSVLGNNIFTFPMVHNIFDPVLHLVFSGSTLPEIAHRMVYYAVIQSLIAGIGIYAFLIRSGRSQVSATIGALGYAFCGAFMGFSTWWASVWVPNLLAGTAVVLWSFKKWQQDGSWAVLCFSIMYFTISTQVTITLYQLLTFGLCYLIVDNLKSVCIHKNGEITVVQHSPSARSGVILSKVALIGSLGVLSMGVVLIPHFYYMFFENHRFSSFFPILQLPDPEELFSVIVRFFSNDILGTANYSQRYGYKNYFEHPFLYCGTVFLIAVPVCIVFSFFKRNHRREMKRISLFLLPFGLALFLPGIRTYLFYGGKTAEYYRWMCAFTTAAGIISGTYALDIILKESEDKKLSISIISVMIFLISILVGISFFRWQILDQDVFRFVIIALVINSILLILPASDFKKTLLILAVFSELIWQSYYTLTHDRHTLIKSAEYSMEHSSIYNYKPMLEALDEIKHQEKSEFYRISKTPDYYGWPEFDNSSICQQYLGTNGYTGFNNKNTIAFFLKTKIALPKHEIAGWLPGFQNRHVLDNLVGVKYYVKRKELFVPHWAELIKKNRDVEIFKNSRAFPLGVVYHQYFWQHEFDKLQATVEQKDNIFMTTAVISEETQQKEMLQKNKLLHVSQPLQIIANDLQIAEVIKEKQNHAMEIISFDNDSISGKISTDQPGIIFFSIPYDSGWHVYIDDQEVEKLKVNIGFLGAIVSSGEHNIRLSYMPPAFQVGKVVSLFALTFIGMGVTLFRKQFSKWLTVRDFSSVNMKTTQV